VRPPAQFSARIDSAGAADAPPSSFGGIFNQSVIARDFAHSTLKDDTPPGVRHLLPGARPTMSNLAHEHPNRSGSTDRPSGVVLLVDDEEAVRSYCKMVLELDGWQVLAAENGEAACRVAAAHPGEIHLLLTDVVMPGMNGRELANRLRQDRPDMKVLFLSGFHDDHALQAGVDAEELHFLGKPFTPTVLREKLREVMGEGSRAGK